MVGLVLVLFYIVFFYIKNDIAKCWAVLFLVTGILAICFVPSLNNFFIDEMLFNNRISEGLNIATSGRLTHFKVFLEHFDASPLIGNGRVRVESFPLSALAGFGISAGSFIIIFALLPLFTSINELTKKRNSTLLTILLIFSIISLANCLFEEQAPFGPGTKCFFLWFIYGIYIGKRDKLYYYENPPASLY